MRALLSFALCLVAEVNAAQRNPPLAVVRKDGQSGAVSILYANLSTSATPPQPPIIPESALSTELSASETISGISINTLGPSVVPIRIPPSVPSLSASIDTVSTLDSVSSAVAPITVYPDTNSSCAGMVTYFGSVPPTVYLTVTEGYDVTVTASNASISAPDIYITPLPPCVSTIVPAITPALSVAVATTTLTIDTLITTTSDISTTIDSSGSVPMVPHLSLASEDPLETVSSISSVPHKSSHRPGKPSPQLSIANPTVIPAATASAVQPPLEGTPAVEGTPVIVVSTLYSQVPAAFSSAASYTSYVIVTKKTPALVIATSTSPPPNFQLTPTTHQNVGTTSGASRGGAGRNPGLVPVIQSFTSGPPIVIPASTTINNVGITVFPSSVGIGGQVVSVPVGTSQTTVQISGTTFTIQPSAIVAPGTTIAINPTPVNQVVPPSHPSTTQVTVAPGVLVAVGDTAAVIDSTTYRIGSDARPTTVIVAGQTISLGPSGVVLPSTTIFPIAAAATDSETPYVVETAGGITLAVGPSNVIVSGTTYRIGSAAPTLTTVIGGQTVSIGPSGVGFKTTTIHPTTVTIGAHSSSGNRVTTSASGTGLSISSNNGADTNHDTRIPIIEMLGWILGVGFLGRIII